MTFQYLNKKSTMHYTPWNFHAARLNPGVGLPAARMLCVWWWIPTKAESQRLGGEDRPRNVGLCNVKKDADAIPLSTPWRSEIARVTERRNGPLGLRDDDDGISNDYRLLVNTV